MNVLVLTPRLPWPPDRGDRLLSARLLEVLARRHRVTLVSFVDGREAAGARARLEAMGIAIHTVHLPRWLSAARTGLALLGREPLQIAYYRSARMRKLVAELGGAEGFDAAIAMMARMAPYASLARARCRIAFLTDSLGVSLDRRAGFESGLRRRAVRLEAARIGAFERAVAHAFDRTWLVSAADRAGFPESDWPRIDIVPNGFPEELLALPLDRPAGARLLFVGHLGVSHNVDSARVLARDVLPRIRTHRPDATLRLVGADPAPAVRALHAPPLVEVTGFVSDLAAEYGSANLFLAPLRFAAGVQNKIIESLAAGLPVITSRIAAEGLGAPDSALDVADDPETMAARALELLADDSARLEGAARGRAFVREHFAWDHLERALGRAVAGAPPVPGPAGS